MPMIVWGYSPNGVALPSIYGSVWRGLYKKSLIINNAIQFPSTICLGEDMVFNTLAFLFASRITFINDYLNCAKALGYAIPNDILINIAESDILEYARRNNIPARVVNIAANAMLSEEFDYVNISGNYEVCTELLGALSIIESIDDI